MNDSIRRAKEQDIPAIMKLLLQVDMVHHAGRPDLFKGPATKYTEAELRGMLADDQRPVFVYADADGQVLGHAFCIFQQHEENAVLTNVLTLYIDDLCVDEAHRGRHIGQALYEYVLDFARRSGCYNVTLNVWAENKAALAFYQKQGLKTQKIGMEMIL